LKSVISPGYHRDHCITFDPLNHMLNQTNSNAAQAMRSGAAYACARCGYWCMPSSFAAMTSPQAERH